MHTKVKFKLILLYSVSAMSLIAQFGCRKAEPPYSSNLTDLDRGKSEQPGETDKVPVLATSQNISSFELVQPELTSQEQLDFENGELVESDELYQKNLFENSVGDSNYKSDLINKINEDVNEAYPIVTIEIYQNSPKVNKQFLVMKQNQKIRFVFAVSTGSVGHSTPAGEYSVFEKQLWRHMSYTYPSSGENNMDHLTYFRPMYGFHATTFGAYRMLGKRDSHGCVRLGRPEARAVYGAIRHQLKQVRIIVHSASRVLNPPDEDLPKIKSQLAKDFNLLQMMLTSHNRGDVPFAEKSYFDFLNTGKNLLPGDPLLKKIGARRIIEINSDQDLFNETKHEGPF